MKEGDPILVASRALGVAAGAAALVGGVLGIRAWQQPGVPPPRLSDLTALGNLVVVVTTGLVLVVVAVAPHRSGRTGLLIGTGLLLLPSGAGYGGTPESFASLGGLCAFVAGSLAMMRTTRPDRALVAVLITVLAGFALAVVSGNAAAVWLGLHAGQTSSYSGSSWPCRRLPACTYAMSDNKGDSHN